MRLFFAGFVLAAALEGAAFAEPTAVHVTAYGPYETTFYVWPTVEGVDRCAAPCTLHVSGRTLAWVGVPEVSRAKQWALEIPAEMKTVRVTPRIGRAWFFPAGIVLVSLGAASFITSMGFWWAAKQPSKNDSVALDGGFAIGAGAAFAATFAFLVPGLIFLALPPVAVDSEP